MWNRIIVIVRMRTADEIAAALSLPDAEYPFLMGWLCDNDNGQDDEELIELYAEHIAYH